MLKIVLVMQSGMMKLFSYFTSLVSLEWGSVVGSATRNALTLSGTIPVAFVADACGALSALSISNRAPSRSTRLAAL